MSGQQPNNPLHSITLENIVVSLVDHYGWEMLGKLIDIRCFNHDPSIKSSLKFLRKTPWAREKVEKLYLDTQKRKSIWPSSN
ncbi:VF530 family protein [Methylophaga sp. OBS4]|uniref:VF530 family protein n=1 Tax=Methylophaga sp. OBS4 TaxID=2991935 RepID=UPI00224CBF02|nr:VF530 family protein [Methylophaga sp. OBS4]MCX4187844.1 VF530 family protein [Methylophaga sp. OBS4]